MDLMTTGELLGNYGEFIGSVGVFATLIYLAIQLRQTRAIVMAQAYQARSDALQDLSMRMAESDALSEIEHKLRSADWPANTEAFETLTPIEQSRYRNYLTAHLHRMNNLAHQYDAGLLTDDYYHQGIRGTIVFWMRSWDAAGVMVPVSERLSEIHVEALALEPSEHEELFGGLRARGSGQDQGGDT